MNIKKCSKSTPSRVGLDKGGFIFIGGSEMIYDMV
jgi:hypothetical protein